MGLQKKKVYIYRTHVYLVTLNSIQSRELAQPSPMYTNLSKKTNEVCEQGASQTAIQQDLCWDQSENQDHGYTTEQP